MGKWWNWWLAYKLGQFAWERRPRGSLPQRTTNFELLLRTWFSKALLAFMLYVTVAIIAGSL